MLRLLPVILLVATPARAGEPAPTGPLTPEDPAQALEPEPPAATGASLRPSPDFTETVPWAIWLGGGLNLFLLDDTPLSNQLDAVGYRFDAGGPALSLSVERYVLDWLVVGGTLDVRWIEAERDDPRLASQILPRTPMGLTRVGAGAYVQPTLCLMYERCRDDGIFFGALLGVAFGPTFWTLRDATEFGAFIRFDLALTWYFQVSRVLLALRVGHALLWQSEMGPSALGHGFEWTPTIEVRAGWRW